MRRFILIMVALSFVAVALSGCATGGGGSTTTQGTAAPAGQPAQSPIVGKWKLTEDNGPIDGVSVGDLFLLEQVFSRKTPAPAPRPQ